MNSKHKNTLQKTETLTQTIALTLQTLKGIKAHNKTLPNSDFTKQAQTVNAQQLTCSLTQPSAIKSKKAQALLLLGLLR